jgi:hypothetical protein
MNGEGMGKMKKSDMVRLHDWLARNVLDDTELAADLLRNYLEPGLASSLAWDSLKREVDDAVEPELLPRKSVLLYSARFEKDRNKKLMLFMFLEHQSRQERLMSFRMLDYLIAVHQEMIPKLNEGDRLPYPLMIVLHHGKSPWKKILTMGELVAMPSGRKEKVMDFPIHMIDIAAMPVDKLRGHPMVCALLDSLQSASMGVLPSRISGIFGSSGFFGDEFARQSV